MSFKGVLIVFQGCLKEISRGLHECFKGLFLGVSRVFKECFIGVSRVFKGVLNLFQE